MKPKKAIIISDVHFSSADDALVELVAFKFGKDFKPDIIFLNGDIIDLYAVSRYPKHPASNQTVEADVNATIAFLKRLRETFPKAEIHYVFGNHEHRLESYISEKAPALFPYVNLEKILGLHELRIKCYRGDSRENWMKYKNLYIGHWDKALSNSASTAQALLREKGVSLIQGHVHRAGMTAKRFIDRTLYAYENPCLANLNSVDYVKDPNWQQGFTVVYFTEKNHHAYVVPIKNGEFVFNDKLYNVR